MRTALRKMGNSSGVIIPKPLLAQVSAEPGDSLDVSVEEGRIVLSVIKRKPREGWAEDSVAIGMEEPPLEGWLEFGNEDDAALEW